jgi:WD40 repeat protein
MDAVRRTGIYPQGPVTWWGSLVLFSATTEWLNDFSGMTQGSANLWTIRLSQIRGRVAGEPRRATFGSASEGAGGVLPGGDLVFSSKHYNVSVFETLLDERAKPLGPTHRVFSAPGSYVLPYLSRDGSKLVAVSDRSGSVDIWVKDFHTAEEEPATFTKTVERNPVVSDDNSIFYGVREGPRYPIYRTSIRGESPTQVCSDCGSISDLSPGRDYVLFHTGEPWSAYTLDLRTGKKSLLLAHSGRTYSSRLSPDGKWVAFHVDPGADEMPRRVMLAPFSPGHQIEEDEWIPISDAGESAFDPCWSADGKLLFFFSNRDGNRCIWARRLNSRTKHPEGPTFAVVHLHDMAATIPDALGIRLSAASKRIIFGAVDLSSTIYRLKHVN